MSRPASLTTRLRQYLAARLAVHPPAGEAWCWGCALNRGRTVVLSANGLRQHQRRHLDEAPKQRVFMEMMQYSSSIEHEEKPGG